MERLSTDQQKFLDYVEQGRNVFLTGKAGTGKSFIVSKAIEKLKEEGKQVVALAPTGVAANNIGGQTIHSFFSLDPHGMLDFEAARHIPGEKRRMFQKIDVIFIDEVSMLRPDILDGINFTLIKNGCNDLSTKQLVFIGDLKQLPAPIDDNMRAVIFKHYPGEQFFDAAIYQKLAVEEISLGEVFRQTNEEFISNLNIIREGGKSEYFRQFVSKEAKGIVLAPHNVTVLKYNQAGLKALDGKLYTYQAKVEGNAKAGDFNLETMVLVKEGAKIMYLANSKENNLVNGTLGIFRIKDGNPMIDVGGVLYKIEEVSFEKKQYVLNDEKDGLELRRIGSIKQIPIKLAYALTIHKSQGLTFDEVTLDLTLPCFSKGQMYTALSRVRTPEGLRIITK